jgi:hypothetical protein
MHVVQTTRTVFTEIKFEKKVLVLLIRFFQRQWIQFLEEQMR